MNNVIEAIDYLNKNILWDKYMPAAIIFVGLMFTVITRFFQFAHVRHWLSNTVCSLFGKKSKSRSRSDSKSISQFQSLCTALGATVGTGTIAGVSSAIVCGGPGAVFWMWATAFLSMMTVYAENVLGIYFRRKNASGSWCGGAMYYLRDGVGSRSALKNLGAALAALYAIFTVLSSFCMGNLVQVNTISVNLESVFNVDKKLLAVLLSSVTAIAVIGGIGSVASFAEKLVPFMVIMYISSSVYIIACSGDMAMRSFGAIFKFAFGMRSFKGAAVGLGVRQAVSWGIRRGIFSNEAGLGSSACVGSSSDVKEPVRQGMWGIFAVFTDTIVICTLTALVVLSSGFIDLENGTVNISAADSSLVTEAFNAVFGRFGGIFMSTAIFMFAFSTVLGWSCYGLKSWEYLFGSASCVIYKIIYVLTVYFGCIIPTAETYNIWVLSDTFNAFMAVPNLIGLVLLSGVVSKVTRNYCERYFCGIFKQPMLSAFDMCQRIPDEKVKRFKFVR